MYKHSNKIQILVLYKNQMRFFMTENQKKPHRHVETGVSHHYYCHYWLTNWTSLNFWDRTKQAYSQSSDCIEEHYLWFTVSSSIRPLSAKYWPTDLGQYWPTDAYWLGWILLLVIQNLSRFPSKFYFKEPTFLVSTWFGYCLMWCQLVPSK